MCVKNVSVFFFESLNLTVYSEISHWSGYNMNWNLQLDIANKRTSHLNTGFREVYL